jgi:4-amino-4-deoxy-L-arabinose transferase-like glycosyltransferase
MKRTITVLSAVVIFGWMAVAGAEFIAQEPGALGFLAGPLRKWRGLQPLEPALHQPLRVADYIRGALASRSFQGLPVEMLKVFAVSVWLFVVFLGTGLWIARLLRETGHAAASESGETLSPLESLAVGGALGMGAWGMGALLLGIARLLYPVLLVAILVLATLLSLPVLREWLAAIRSARRRRPCGIVEWIATILAAAALLLGLLYTLTPAIQSDGLRYHLSAPQVYLREHRIVYLPFNAFTNFPFLIEMLFTLSLAVAGDMAAKMVHFDCFVLCGLFIALLVSQLIKGLDAESPRESAEAQRPRWAARLPLLAALVFWTTPTALVVGAWEFIDLGTALFLVAMVYALVRWHGGGTADGQPAMRWRWIAALFLGFLIGTKYTMVTMFVVVPLALFWELPSFAPSRRWDLAHWLRSSVLVVAVGAIVASPWFIKNVVFTRNPVYPLAWGIFDGGEWSAENARFYLDKSSEKGFNPRRDRNIGDTLRHLIGTPWYGSLQPSRYENQFLGPVFLLWIPLLLLVLMDAKHRAPREGPFRLVVLFALAYGALWYFTYQSNRLLIPAMALLSVLVAYSLAVAERTARGLSNAAIVVLLAACLYNIEWSGAWIVSEVSSASAKPSAAAYWLGFQSRDSYIREAFPPYGVFQLMPGYVRPGEKVLFVGEYRACYCPVAWRASDWFDTPLILHYIRQTPDNDALLDRLLDEGIRWVFYNDSEWAKYESLFLVGTDTLKPRFTPAERERYHGLFRRERTTGNKYTVLSHPRLNRVGQWKDQGTDLWMELYEVRARRN